MPKVLVFGSANIDDVYTVAHIVKPGETVSSLKFENFPGGKGLNQCVAFARSGATTCFAGKIGADGTFLKEFLQSLDVDTNNLFTSEVPTGRAIIQVEQSGLNSIVVNDGANATVDAQMVETVLDHFTTEDVLVMQNELTITPYLLEQAAKRQMRIAFNPSPINDRIASCDLSLVTWLFINETEGLELTGKQDPKEIIASLLAQYPNLKIILTLGVDGSYYADQSGSTFAPAVTVQAVDTTGAGDTFTGYFISSVLADLPVADCLSRAAHASALSVSKKGAAISIPSLEQVTCFQNK